MFEIARQAIRPGEQKVINIPLMRMFTHNQLLLPLKVIVGKQSGPTLFISAAIHGDEVNGVETIRRLLKNPILAKLKGVIVAAPVVNVHGLLNRSRYLPDRRDLNRSFPGSDHGSLAARVAHVFLDQVVTKCDYGIDLHSGSDHRENLSHIRAKLDDPETRSIAESFGTPVILDTVQPDGSLRAALVEQKKPIIVFEGGESLRLDELVVRSGLKGIISVMRSVGMLPRLKAKVEPTKPFVARSSVWVRAPESGLFRSFTKLGSRVKKGDSLGAISDPFGEMEVEVVTNVGGIVLGRSTLPLINEGEALFHIAKFEKPSKVQKSLESYHSRLLPDDLDHPIV
jgi:predicted deacylase